MPKKFEDNWLAGKIERERRAHGEFFASLHGALREIANQVRGVRAGVKIRREFRVQENPAATVETVS